jgi:hypothetical protein
MPNSEFFAIRPGQACRPPCRRAPRKPADLLGGHQPGRLAHVVVGEPDNPPGHDFTEWGPPGRCRGHAAQHDSRSVTITRRRRPLSRTAPRCCAGLKGGRRAPPFIRGNLITLGFISSLTRMGIPSCEIWMYGGGRPASHAAETLFDILIILFSHRYSACGKRRGATRAAAQPGGRIALDK